MTSWVATSGWSSATFESAVENRSFRLILIQAAAFSLFMILSDAWNDFFGAIVRAFVPKGDKGDLWFTLVRAITSTVFCIFLLFVMITLANTTFDRKSRTLVLCGWRFHLSVRVGGDKDCDASPA